MIIALLVIITLWCTCGAMGLLISWWVYKSEFIKTIKTRPTIIIAGIIGGPTMLLLGFLGVLIK